MMKLKNRPEKYVRRSDLPGRTVRAEKGKVDSERKPQARDFMSVEVDENFYFTFRPSTQPKG